MNRAIWSGSALLALAIVAPTSEVSADGPTPGVTYNWTACRLTTSDCSMGAVPCFTPGQTCNYCLSGLKDMTCEGFALASCKFIGLTPGECGEIWISFCDGDLVCIPFQVTDDTCPRVTCEVPSSEG